MEKATEELDKRTAALNKLNSEKSELLVKIEALQTERAAATKEMAAGDDRKRHIVLEIESKISPLSLRLEGIDQLIKDAETEANKAKADLEEAMAEEETRLSAFIAECDGKERERLIASLPVREGRIINLHHSLCKELAELQVDLHQYQINQIQELLPTFPLKIRASIDKNSLRPLFRREAFQDIVIWPLSDALPGRGPIDPGQIAEMRRAQRVQALTTEYKSKNK